MTVFRRQRGGARRRMLRVNTRNITGICPRRRGEEGGSGGRGNGEGQGKSQYGIDRSRHSKEIRTAVQKLWGWATGHPGWLCRAWAGPNHPVAPDRPVRRPRVYSKYGNNYVVSVQYCTVLVVLRRVSRASRESTVFMGDDELVMKLAAFVDDEEFQGQLESFCCLQAALAVVLGLLSRCTLPQDVLDAFTKHNAEHTLEMTACHQRFCALMEEQLNGA